VKARDDDDEVVGGFVVTEVVPMVVEVVVAD